MHELVERLRHRRDLRLLVLGDVILDLYTWGETERVSPEAPVLVLRCQRREARLGGAGFVAAVLQGLGVQTTLASAVGEDAQGRTVEDLLRQAGATLDVVERDPQRPTTTKERFLGNAASREAQQVLRVDSELRLPLCLALEARLLKQVRQALPSHQALLVSDYAKGVCTPRLLSECIAAARERGVPVLVDPARGVDYGRYRGATLLAPNRVEAEAAAGRLITSPEAAEEAGRQLCARCALEAAVIKLDRDGIVLARPDRPRRVFPAWVKSARDVTGAGDVVLALLGLGQAAGLDLEESVAVASAAAGAEVAKIGAAPLAWEEVEEAFSEREVRPKRKIVNLDVMARLAEGYRREGRRIVLSNGCFDLLHAGHVAHLQEAAQLADVLVVAINSDDSVRRLKGPDRPIVSQSLRAAMLSALECVEHVVVFDQDTPHEILRRLRPEVLAKGATTDEIIGREFVERYGGFVCATSGVPRMSTTRLVNLLKSNHSPCRA
jgi:D-beta-D-heptose 7-phosphate kinase/D-beta-D-heptose 1-phosphate adenosyltransferase